MVAVVAVLVMNFVAVSFHDPTTRQDEKVCVCGGGDDGCDGED